MMSELPQLILRPSASLTAVSTIVKGYVANGVAAG